MYLFDIIGIVSKFNTSDNNNKKFRWYFVVINLEISIV